MTEHAPTPAPTPAPGPWRPPTRLAVLFLAGLVWFSCFFWSSKFGIYEDDYILIEVQMNQWRWPQYKLGVVEAFRQYMQGRPLHFVIGHTFAWLTTKPGGTFGAAYVAAFAVQFVNAWLLLLVARRAIGPRLAPLAAVFFAIAPADTSHQFLHTNLYGNPSITFMLLSVLAYQNGRLALSYLPAALTLLTYETFFFPLCLTPFLGAEAPRVRRVLVHGAVMGAILLTAFAVRSKLGESRVADELADKTVAAKKAFRLATVGPVTSAKALVTKPVSTAERLSDPKFFTGDGLKPLAGAWAIFAAGAFAALLLATGTAHAESVPRSQLLRVGLAAVAMIVISYPISLNRDPTVLEGRMSTVHSAGNFGWALLLGALVGLAVSALPRTGRRVLWAAVAIYLGVLAAYQVTVQRDYARCWGEQRRFWGEVNRLCPDMGDNTVIMYPYPVQPYPAVEVNSHADYLLPERMYLHNPPWHVPASRQPPMAVHVGIYIAGHMPTDYVGYNWPEVKLENGELVFQHWTGRKLPLKEGNVIALYPDGKGGYRRLTGSLTIHGVELPLHPLTGPNKKLTPTALRWQLSPP